LVFQLARRPAARAEETVRSASLGQLRNSARLVRKGFLASGKRAGPRPRMSVLATSGRRSDHASGPDAAKATGPGIPTMISCRRAGTPLRQLVGLNASADIRTPRATAPPPLPKALRGPRDRLERRVLRLARLSACGSRRVCSRHKNSAPRGSGRRLRHPARAAARSP
jgi:hypothetical protein